MRAGNTTIEEFRQPGWMAAGEDQAQSVIFYALLAQLVVAA